jgi:hypothetical protein
MKIATLLLASFLLIGFASAQTAITEDIVITEPGEYYLDANVSSVRVEVDGNVTILGNGFYIKDLPSGYCLDIDTFGVNIIVDGVGFENCDNNIQVTAYGTTLTVKNSNLGQALTGNVNLVATTISATFINNTFSDSDYGLFANNDPVNNITLSANRFINITLYGVSLGEANNVLINNSNTSIDLFGTTGDVVIQDSTIDKYSFLDVKPQFKTSNLATLEFTENITASGTNLSGEVIVGGDLIYVNASKSGLNKPARLTFFNIPPEWTTRYILAGTNQCPIGFCINETALNASDITFTVQDFTFFYYLISNDIIIPEIEQPNTSYLTAYVPLEGAGAGLAAFIGYISIPLFIFILLLSLIAAIIYIFKETIPTSINHFRKN